MARDLQAVLSGTLDAALGEELEQLRSDGLYRALRSVERRGGAELLVDGRPALDFASNDYLGLATDARVAGAIARASREDGTEIGIAGAAASRSISGNHPLHEQLEHELARLKGTEAALLFGSGFVGNTGAIPALAGRGDVIYSDALNHASIIDGCRLSRAMILPFPHADLAVLGAMLAADGPRYRRRFVAVEGVYSMDGDLFPLEALVSLARAHDAWIYLDDAHATGVLGATGAGSAEHWDVAGEIDVTLGTLGKALGISGAFIAGGATLREFLLNRARSFIFTTAPPPALAAGALTALAISRDEAWRRERLWANAMQLREGLERLGGACDARLPPGERAGHIVPLVLGDAERTVRLGGRLAERGFLVGAVRPPTVPAGGSRLRITVSAAHTPEHIDALLGALRELLPGA